MHHILFMGRKKVAARCLEYLAARTDVAIAGVLTDSHLAVSATRDVATRIGAPIFSYDEAMQAADSGSLSFDLGLSMLYWRKLRGSLLTSPSRGVINFHPAPLPQYKGTAGYNLAILEGRPDWAITAHYIDESIDTGPIIESQTFPISPDSETAQSLEAVSQRMLYEQFVRVADAALASPNLLPTTPNGPGRYVSRPEMEAMKLIQPGDDVDRKIRAFWFPPYDGAYMEMGGKKYTLVSREILKSLAEPGTSSLFSPPSNG